MITVEVAGPLTTVQDPGRPGLAHLGVGASGAADRPSFALANRLVGNVASAAALETTFGGVVAHFERPAWIAVTGAPVPITVDGRATAHSTARFVPAGGRLLLGGASSGVRSYLAVRGGIDVEPVLGSRATDLLTGIGPRPLRAGDRLPVGSATDGPPLGVDVTSALPPIEPVLDVLVGPRADWFTAAAWPTLLDSAWTVSPDSNRIAVRLTGPALRRRRAGELASEGLVDGAVQVPPSGRPVLFLADRPVTGGYPVLAVLTDDAIALAAQVRPGQSVRFRRRSTG